MFLYFAFKYSLGALLGTPFLGLGLNTATTRTEGRQFGFRNTPEPREHRSRSPWIITGLSAIRSLPTTKARYVNQLRPSPGINQVNSKWERDKYSVQETKYLILGGAWLRVTRPRN